MSDLRKVQEYLNREIEHFLLVADSLPMESAEYWEAVDAAENLRITERNLHSSRDRFFRL